MSDIDTGIGATIGAVIVGALAAARELVTRKKRRSDPPDQLPPSEPSGLSVRVGDAHRRIDHVEQEIRIMRHETSETLADLRESVDALKTSSASQAAILPRIEKQLDRLEEASRRATTNKE